ncbi:MAG: serine/threonine protein kinase [Planctomyces sp.]|nr:serine/threonine protein kinase [Planctomyces sp.]
MSQRQIGPFLIERQLGVGGMGVVYLATYTETGKKVALKVLTPALSSDEKLLKRFEREIDILKRMNHPNIVKYYGGGTENHQRYYAMEYIDGGSLQDILKKRKRLNWEQTIQVGKQLCRALEHAHNAGIIHRDLKPANLFITKQGKLKLGDFGIARDTEATALTAAGKTVGTYAYMAPEQIHGNAPISRKTDIYATGCLLYEAMTGETPFTGSNAAEMLMQHLNDDPHNVREFAPECPIWLDQLIERMLAKEPDDRPFDALAVHTELSEIHKRMTESIAEPLSATKAVMSAGESTGSVGADGTTQSKPKKKKKRKEEQAFYEQTWFLAACLLGVIAVTVYLLMPPGEEKLFLAAREAMSSSDETVRRAAREKVMLPYLEQYPEGEFRSEIQKWSDQIQVDILAAQADRKARSQKEPRDEFEAAFLAGLELERDSKANPLEPIEKFLNLTQRYGNSPEAVHWVMLAERHLRDLKESLLKNPNRFQLIYDRMMFAEEQQSSGKTQVAREIWVSFYECFSGVRDVEEFHLYARRRMNGEEFLIPKPAANADNVPPSTEGGDPENGSAEGTNEGTEETPMDDAEKSSVP